jgi:uncharacterized lipoprotein
MRLIVILTCLIFSGCALSPQMVTITPDPEVPAANVGGNQPVAVTVTDKRAQQALGTRGGVYKDTALIRASNDLGATVAEIIKSGLQRQGFNAYNPPEGATQLEVVIDTLEYIPESGMVVNRVDTRAVVIALASRSAADHRGVFKSEVQHDIPVTPSAERNQAMITDVLKRSLERLLSDPKLLAFLSGENEPGEAVDTEQ